jgi:transcriptional regulator with XRE-family HTH domain
VSDVLPGVAGKGAAHLSTLAVDASSRDHLSAAQEVVGRAVSILPERPISDRTQNGPWLLYTVQCLVGRHPSLNTPHEIDDETLNWQEWTVSAIDELQRAGASGSLPWERLLVGLAACVNTVGSNARVAGVIGMSDANLSAWLRGKVTPTLNRLLELCYVLDVSPLRLMTADPEVLRETIQTSEMRRPPRPKRPERHWIDGERALALMHAVLDGSEAPLPVFEIERRLGLGARTLKNRFPHECALITAQYRTHLSEQARQRTEKKCEEVRKVMLSLHAQEIYPSSYLLSSLLSELHIMRKPEGQATWHAVLRELGLEPGHRKKR